MANRRKNKHDQLRIHRRVDRSQRDGDGIILCGAGCQWFDYSTAGNFHFGYIAYRAKIDQGIAAVAGGVLEQWDLIRKEHQLPNLRYCLQNASIFFCDNPGDQAAVDFGYYLAEKYPNIITEVVLRTELTLAEMKKFQSPPSNFIQPHPAYPQINTFNADHFNN